MGPVHIGRYRIIDELGRGGMGVVYRGEDPVLERQVAVKILPPKKLTQKAIDRFLREAKTAARLDSPYIVKIHDIGEVDEIHFIVMEFVQGQTLGELMGDEEAPSSEAMEQRLRIFWQVLQAVRYAHENGVIHRDLKPDNIMVTSSGQVKVMDFGLAFFEGSHSLTEVGQVMGTAAYVSPEQALGHVTDQRTDVYSLGVILFEMVTGRWPFSASNPLEMFRKVAEAPPPSPRDFNASVPLSLEMIILRSLRKSPADRYQSVAEFLTDFEHFLKRSSLRVELPSVAPPSFEVSSHSAVSLEPGNWKAPTPQAPPQRPVEPIRPPAPIFPAPGPALRAPVQETQADVPAERPPSASASLLFSSVPPPMTVSPPPPPVAPRSSTLAEGATSADHDPIAEALGYPVPGQAPPAPPPPPTPRLNASPSAPPKPPGSSSFQPYKAGPGGGIASSSWLAVARTSPPGPRTIARLELVP